MRPKYFTPIFLFAAPFISTVFALTAADSADQPNILFFFTDDQRNDLARDPDELENLADDSDYKDILANLRKRTGDLVDGYGGPLKPYVPKPKK
jgi:hypothetical protein